MMTWARDLIICNSEKEIILFVNFKIINEN